MQKVNRSIRLKPLFNNNPAGKYDIDSFRPEVDDISREPQEMTIRKGHFQNDEELVDVDNQSGPI